MIDLKIKAIRQLGYDGGLSVKNDVFTFQSNENVPSESAIQDKLTELQVEYEANEYQRNRAVAYPSIQDQLDMQYHDSVNGTTTWKDTIAKVKSDNPKPE